MRPKRPSKQRAAGSNPARRTSQNTATAQDQQAVDTHSRSASPAGGSSSACPSASLIRPSASPHGLMPASTSYPDSGRGDTARAPRSGDRSDDRQRRCWIPFTLVAASQGGKYPAAAAVIWPAIAAVYLIPSSRADCTSPATVSDTSF